MPSTTSRRRSRRSIVEDLERRPSPETAFMLLLLAAEGPMDYHELAARLGLDVKSVRDRVRYFTIKGWLAKNSPFISLTEIGRVYVMKYASYLARVAQSKYGDLVLSVTHTLLIESGGIERTKAEQGGLRRTRAEQGGTRRTRVGEGLSWREYSASIEERAARLLEEWIVPCAESRLGRRLEREERKILLHLTRAYLMSPSNPYLRLNPETLLERFGSVEPYERALRELVDAGVVYRSRRGPLYRLDRSCAPRLSSSYSSS